MSNNGEIKEIQKVTSEKDLGVIVDNKLLFREHIGQKVDIANRNLGLIFKTFEFMDKDMFRSLYKSIVRPHLEYATVRTPQLPDETNIEIRHEKPEAYLLTSNKYE